MADNTTTNDTAITASSDATAKKDKLGDRMKGYEAETNIKLDKSKAFIIRLDGHKFSSFTRPFKKPFDERIHRAMVATASDVLVEFNALTVFTCSDEITLVFAPADDAAADAPTTTTTTTTTTTSSEATSGEGTDNGDAEKKEAKKKSTEFIYNGKIQKLVSLAAGYASTCFFIHLHKEQFDPVTEPKLSEHVKNAKPYFDGRAFSVPSLNEALNNMVWRAHFDWRRNSISTLAQANFPHKQLISLNSDQLLEKLKNEKNIDWNDMPDWYKWGSTIKREKYEIEAVDHSGAAVKAVRTRVAVKHFDVTFSEENVKLLFTKYWN